MKTPLSTTVPIAQLYGKLTVRGDMSSQQLKQQAGWFLRPDCAPSSECPQFGSAEWCGRNISGSAHLSSTAAARRLPPRGQYCRGTLRSAGGCRNGNRWNSHRGKLQNLSTQSVLFESSPIFYDTLTQKMMDQNFEIKILWFLRIWNFQDGTCDTSAADLGHYVRGQTRSQ